MRKLLGSLLLLLLIGGSAVAQSSDGFVPLFDGKSLKGWIVEDQYARNFSVKDGNLHVEGTGGWLHTGRQYSDFILKLRLRFVTDQPVTNSGIYIRTPGKIPLYAGWPYNSYEVRLTSGGEPVDSPGDPRWGGAFLTYRAPLATVSFDTQAALRAYRKTSEWQDYEIRAVGSSVSVIINGQQVGRASNVGNPAGLIGIQCESGAIDFESIEIKELHGATETGVESLTAIRNTHSSGQSDGFVSLFDGKTLDGWDILNGDSRDFFVRDGVIRGHGGPSLEEEKSVVLRTKRQYSDFILTLQVRFVTPYADSGVLVRMTSPTKEGYQVQLRDGTLNRPVAWSGSLLRTGNDISHGETTFDFGTALQAYKNHEKQCDWDTYEIAVIGQRASVKVNGLAVTTATNLSSPSGYIYFLAEMGDTEFRSIQIKEVR